MSAPHALRGGRATAVAVAAAVALLAAPRHARAQDAVVAPEAETPEVAPETTPPSLEARLDALEAESETRARELEEARARVAALEAAAVEEAAVEAAAAPPGPTLRPLASMVTRFEHREGYDALGSARALQNVGCYGGTGAAPTLSDSDCVRYRARVGFEITSLALGPDVSAVIRFLPQVAGHWAMPGLGIGVPGGIGASSSGGAVDAVLGLHEASLALQLGTAVRAEIGRFEMNYGDAVVIGNLDWHPNARAFDGARIRVTPESSYWIDAFWTLVNEGHSVSLTGAPASPGFGQADQSFYGVYAGLGSLIDARPSTALDVYALFRQTNNRSALDAMGNLTEREWSLRATIGARFRYRVDLVDLRVEGAFQTGREGALRTMPGTGPFGSAAIVVAGFGIGEVGVNLLEDHLRFALEGNYASGNAPCAGTGCIDATNEAYDALFPTGHAFLGLTNVMGNRSNVASGVLHFTGRPVDQLAFNLDWHVFVVPERAPNMASGFVGQEGDLNIVWTPWAGFRTRAMYGIFIPETAGWRPPGVNYTTSPVHFLEVEIAYVLR